MTLYLVKHGDADYRLHNPDGTETGDSWSWSADWSDPEQRTDAMVSDVDSTVQYRSWNYRDVTVDGETVPW